MEDSGHDAGGIAAMRLVLVLLLALLPAAQARPARLTRLAAAFPEIDSLMA